jgi:hypothetical protein
MTAIQESSPLGAGGHPGPSTQDIQGANSRPTTNRHDTPQAKSHPLGPLTAQEIAQSAGFIRACWPDDIECHFKVVTLLEPAKSELLPYLVAERAGQDPGSIDRRAFVVYYFRGTVSLGPPPRIRFEYILLTEYPAQPSRGRGESYHAQCRGQC